VNVTRGVWKIVLIALLFDLAAAACGQSTPTQPAAPPSATTVALTTQPSAAAATAPSPTSSPVPSAAVAGGSVYVGTASGGVHAIGGNGVTAAAPSASPVAAAAPTPVPTLAPTPSPRGSPIAVGPSAAKLLWSATGGAGGLSFPNGLALDPQGRLWVADTGHSRFAIYNPDGSFAGDWGGPGSADGQFRLQRSDGAGFGAVAFAPDGSFYVLDVGNHRVQHFDAHRTFLNTWGSFGTGPGQFSDPIAIAVDSAGAVHVLDDQRGVVETYDNHGNVLGSFATHLTAVDTGGAFALDAAGNVYISSCCGVDGQIRKFDSSGKHVLTMGSAGTGPGQFQGEPGAVAIDADGRVFAIDGYGAPGYAIRVFDETGAYLTSLASGQSGDSTGGFVTGLLLDGHDALYVSIFEGGYGGDHVEKFQLLSPLVTK
jgi:hypothetical protein